jgi:hypothetical protein
MLRGGVRLADVAIGFGMIAGLAWVVHGAAMRGFLAGCLIPNS